MKIDGNNTAISGNTLNSELKAEKLIGLHFKTILNIIINTNKNSIFSFQSNITPLPSDINFNWLPFNHIKAAFEVLTRLCPSKAWYFHVQVLDIIIPQIQPKEGIEPGSTKANMISYAAVRGEFSNVTGTSPLY
jgi:hypothetical protein